MKAFLLLNLKIISKNAKKLLSTTVLTTERADTQISLFRKESL